MRQLCAADAADAADLPQDDDIDTNEWLAWDERAFRWRELEARIEAAAEERRLEVYRIKWDVWRRNAFLVVCIVLLCLSPGSCGVDFLAILSAFSGCVVAGLAVRAEIGRGIGNCDG